MNWKGQMAQDSGHGDGVLHGVVKWFDPVKGFGFVVSDNESTDILLHVNVLRNFGQSSIADGASVEIAVQKTPRGIQAVEILDVKPPEPEEGAGLEDVDNLSTD